MNSALLKYSLSDDQIESSSASYAGNLEGLPYTPVRYEQAYE